MATLASTSTTEGQATNRPPLFDENNYSHWKDKMTLYLQATDYAMWIIVTKGSKLSTKLVDNISVPKTEDECDERDHKLLQANAKAKLTLVCRLDSKEYNRISSCDSAKEIWDKLEVTYEGTNQVKESRIDMLVHSYELFKMNSIGAE
ncbi:hypothetical protein ACSBR1_024478 [Camellia fascicularis]